MDEAGDAAARRERDGGMIAALIPDLCTGCGQCAAVCPTDVFDLTVAEPGPAMPVIARIDDCQTCFICELYCPADAIYVDPGCEVPVRMDPELARNAPTRGHFRRDSGWDEWGAGGRFPNEHWMMEEMFVAARKL